MVFMSGMRKWHVWGGNFRGVDYGNNFGTTELFPYGNGISKHIGFISTKMDTFRRAGLTLLRIGLLDDGRTLFDKDGNVNGYDEIFRCDVKAFLDLAAQFDLHIEFVLLDYLVAGKAEEVNGVWLRGRRSIFEDPNKRNQFINNFLSPFLQEFGSHPALLSIDILNEPEWIISEINGGGWEEVNPDDPNKDDMPIAFLALQNLVSESIILIRQYAPNIFVTMGVSAKYLQMIAEFDLDYYAPHYYPWQGFFVEILDTIPKDKPWILEEFPGKGNLSNYIRQIYLSGGSGSLLWNLSPGIDDQTYDIGNQESKLQEIRSLVDSFTESDSDNDGSPDGWDSCPNTSPGMEIWLDGCPYRRGDTNGDDRLGFDDMAIILQAIAAKRDITGFSLRGDINFDGILNLKDAINILRIFSKKKTEPVYFELSDGGSNYDTIQMVFNRNNDNFEIVHSRFNNTTEQREVWYRSVKKWQYHKSVFC